MWEGNLPPSLRLRSVEVCVQKGENVALKSITLVLASCRTYYHTTSICCCGKYSTNCQAPFSASLMEMKRGIETRLSWIRWEWILAAVEKPFKPRTRRTMAAMWGEILVLSQSHFTERFSSLGGTKLVPTPIPTCRDGIWHELLGCPLNEAKMRDHAT